VLGQAGRSKTRWKRFSLLPEAELAAPWQSGAHPGQMIRLGTFSG